MNTTNTDAPLVHALLTGEGTDDPRLVPRATARTKAAIEDAAFMAHTGETLHGAAHRLGLTAPGLERMLTRYALHNTLARLRNNTFGDPS